MKSNDLCVLIIEDEEDSALLLEKTLQYGGVKTWAAPTAEAALEILKDVKPDLLVVDLALPGMDGWKFLEEVRANPVTGSIPAVVVSAYLTPTVAQKAFDVGFRACFPKPINTATLVQQLLQSVE